MTGPETNFLLDLITCVLEVNGLGVVGGIGILDDGVIISGISSYSGRINGASVFNNGPELGLGTTEYCAFRVTIFFTSSGWV